MEVEAITNALQWIAQARPLTGHAVILTDSQSTLKRIETRQLRTEWLGAIGGTALESVTWMYCPGHAGVQGNEVADNLAGRALVDGEVKLDKPEVMQRLYTHLAQAEEIEWTTRYSIVRMKNLGVRKGEGKKKAG